MIKTVLIFLFFSPFSFAYEPVTDGACGALALPQSCKDISNYCGNVHLDGCIGGENYAGFRACTEFFTKTLGGVTFSKLLNQPHDPYKVYCGTECFGKVAKSVKEMNNINLEVPGGLTINGIRLVGLDHNRDPGIDLFIFRVNTSYNGGDGQFLVTTTRPANSCQIQKWKLSNQN